MEEKEGKEGGKKEGEGGREGGWEEEREGEKNLHGSMGRSQKTKIVCTCTHHQLTLVEHCHVLVEAPDTVEPSQPPQHRLQPSLGRCVLHKLTEPLHRQVLEERERVVEGEREMGRRGRGRDEDGEGKEGQKWNDQPP